MPHFKRSLFTIALTLLLAASALATSVTDLPVKEISGRKYYYYEAKSRETLYSLSHKLNLTQDEILRYNPAASDGISSRMILYFPVDDFSAPAKKVTTTEAKPVVAQTTHDSSVRTHKVERGQTIYGIANHYGITTQQLMDANPEIRDGLKADAVIVIPLPGQAAETVVAQQPGAHASQQEAPKHPVEQQIQAMKEKKVKSINIAVLLPFELDAAKKGPEATRALELYRGFLMAVDTLRDNDCHIHVTALDIGNTEASLAKALKSPALKKAQLIVAPQDDKTGRLAQIAAVARENGALVFNLLSVKDDSYLTNPAMMQANMPHSRMFEKAVSGFAPFYRLCLPVFLKPADAPAEKSELITRLTADLKSRGRAFETITYDGSLKAADLEALPTADSYVFIPVQMSQRDLNKILSSLLHFKEQTTGEVTLFGYPEWILFRGETKENLHKLSTTIYSRFIYDPEDNYTVNLANNYERWYGSKMTSAVPTPGIMGFDAGMYILRALKATDGTITADSPSYQGVQNGFKFVRAPGGGWYNDRFFYVTYRPTGTIDYIDL